MNDIRIPISNPYDGMSCVDIAPDLARQIYLRGKCEVELIRLEAEKDAQVAELTRERDEWKANHDNAVAIKRAVLDRPDLGTQSRRVLELVAERDKALADLAAERERRKQDNAKSEVCCDQIRAEADALRAELAAMKGRKVSFGIIDTGFTHYEYRRGFLAAIDLARAQIRAAGVEVAP